MPDFLNFFIEPAKPEHLWFILVLAGIVTYLTRSGGYIIIARFKSIHPRVKAALEAVPGAVLATLVIPPALTNGPVEFLALVVAVIASFRLPPLVVLAIGMAIVIIGRQLGL